MYSATIRSSKRLKAGVRHVSDPCSASPSSDGRGLDRAAFAQAADQVRHVRELLLEVALVALQPLQHVVALVPALAQRGPMPAAMSTVMHSSPPLRSESERRRCA